MKSYPAPGPQQLSCEVNGTERITKSSAKVKNKRGWDLDTNQSAIREEQLLPAPWSSQAGFKVHHLDAGES